MKLFFEQLDLEKTRANWPEGAPFRPALVKYRRDDSRHWLALSEPLLPGGTPQWAKTEHDEYVRIPLFPYVVPSPEADRSIAFALQLGLSCAGHLPGRVEAFRVVTGVPVQLLYDPATDQNTGLRFWLGFAVNLE
jgi:hypothetical protein